MLAMLLYIQTQVIALTEKEIIHYLSVLSFGETEDPAVSICESKIAYYGTSYLY